MNLTIRKMTVAGVLGAVSTVMGLIPGLGFIPFPTIGMNITILHIPAILAGIAQGPAVGFFVGLIFGITSWTRATIPAFADPLVAILPRLLIGVFAAYAFYGLRRFNAMVALAGAAVVGTITNTGLVLSMAVLRGYWPTSAALGIAATHGPLEIAAAVVAVVAIGGALYRSGFIQLHDRAGRKAN